MNSRSSKSRAWVVATTPRLCPSTIDQPAPLPRPQTCLPTTPSRGEPPRRIPNGKPIRTTPPTTVTPLSDDLSPISRRWPKTCITSLNDAGLRGMGGAGFPTGRKWSLVAGESSDTKFVICNADESEPGTFKDRVLLATLPHLVIEGMVLAG
ncbi:MAG: hypothetical protein CM1200mP2_32110 [Planctomycetaceae bacterium]|nr:MAG: hypothetical protein CM1200mP2_32110 [Planctomycetaceae bacterium]